MKRLQAGDIDYKQSSAAAAVRNKIELDGIKAEKNSTVLKVSYKANYMYYYHFKKKGNVWRKK